MTRRLAWILAGTVAFLFIAGCLDDPAGGSGRKGGGAVRGGGTAGKPGFPDDWAEIPLLGGTEHDHRNVLEHQNRSSANFEVVAWNPLITDYHGKTAGGYFCHDTVAGAERVLSVVHSWVSDVALIINDVTDPLSPKKVGELVMANTHVYDLGLTKDQKSVLLATSPSGAGSDPGMGPINYAADDVYFRDACTGETRPVLGPEQNLPFASGIVHVDITNPRNPQITDFRFFPPSGGHSVQTDFLKNKHIVLVSQASSPGYYVFLELRDGPQGRVMYPLSVYQDPAGSPPGPVQPPVNLPVAFPTGLHDGIMQKHPISGKSLAYLAYGSHSLVVLDIDDPASPKLLSRWSDWKVFGEAAPASPFVHEALPIEGTWEGRHYTFIGEECGGHRPKTPTCLVALLDTTDPAKPTFVGGWTLPIDVQWSGGLMYSLHYLALQNRTLFASNYHGGLWAIDVSTPDAMRTMPTIGNFMPANPSPKPVGRATSYDYAPGVLDASPLPGGELVVYDGTTGLYIVRFDASNPAPPPPPWPFPFNQ